jgi:hypothetical protein
VSVAVHEDGGTNSVVIGPLFSACKELASEIVIVVICGDALASSPDILVFMARRR